jgi:hydrogenase maturation protease
MTSDRGGHIILGIGTEDRGDDAAGLMAARRLLGTGLPATVQILALCGDGVTLMNAWKGAETLTIIDAIEAGVPPGTIMRIDPWKHPIPARAFVSSHLLGLAEAIQISMSFGEFPRTVTMYGIQGGCFGMHAGVSDVVMSAVEEVVNRILAEIESNTYPAAEKPGRRL